MKRLIIFLLMVFLIAVVSGCDQQTDKRANANGMTADNLTTESAAYTCPMHPHYISTDAKGTCPICGMNLVPVEGGQTSNQSDNRKILFYKNPMGLSDISNEPKVDSMGMAYIPVYANDDSGGGGIAVSPEMIQTMGIKTVPVIRTSFGGEVRAYGQVEANTRLESVSASRLEGWIDHLAVRAEGDTVTNGALLYRIYSPDLIGAQKEYLAALKIGNSSRIAAVRQRLLSKGLSQSAIAQLKQKRKLIEHIPITAEQDGLVSMLAVREGDYVKPGTPIMRIQSYDTVWVMAAVPETNLPQVTQAMPVTLRFEGAPSAPSSGYVDYIYPTIDPRTRTAIVRIEVNNQSGVLRPGAYADVVFVQEQEINDQRLAVPSEAILRDSHGAHVVVSLGEGRFQSRDVDLGDSSTGYTEIRSGLQEGEMIVASGQFLLDSESNLREGLAKLTKPTAGYDQSTPLSELPINAVALARIDHLVDAALYFHEALVDGYSIDPYYLDPIIQIANALDTEFSGSQLTPIVQDARLAIQGAKASPAGHGLTEKLTELTTAIDRWLLSGAPSHYQAKGLIFYSDPESNRTWLQEGGLPANPYGGTGGNVIAWPDPMAATSAIRE